MTIKTGEKIPSVTLKKMDDDGFVDIDVASHISGKNVVIFGVPGAFTPTCTMDHLPGYLAQADAIKSKGIDEIICVHVNDPFVSKHWGEHSNVGDAITLLPDGNAELTKALGLELDGSGFGLGTRCMRFSMVVRDGVVETIDIEDEAGTVSVSGAETCLLNLQKAA